MTERTPHIAIGATAYGKPILDRMLTFDTPLPLALQTAYLAFDSTRVSTAGVGFPAGATGCQTAAKSCCRLIKLSKSNRN